MTYRELMQQGEDKLRKAGISDAQYDARYLLEWLMDQPYSYFLLHMMETADADTATRYLQVVDTRSKHVPLQYITQEQIFMGYPFYVNESVLIPRQDTEVLVETALQVILDAKQYRDTKKVRILDMCCGSGCIGISLTKLLREHGYMATLTMADISPDALQVARQNAKALDCSAEAVLSDLFDNIDQTYDIVVSNPPYIRTEDISGLMSEVREHEPYIALDGKEDGLFFYRRIMETIDDYIEENGYVFFEIGFDHAEDLRKIFVEWHFENVMLQRDLAGLDRVIYACK